MRNSPPLRPLEIASIAIFGGLTVASVVIAAVIPMATAVGLLAPVPLALVAARTRPRALLAATVATTAVSFAMAGTGAAFGVIGSAFIGGLVGDLKRRGRRRGAVALATLVCAPVLGGVSVVFLLILKPLRDLMLKTLENTLGGLGNLVGKIPGTDGTVSALESFKNSVVDHWWLWIWISGTVGTVLSIVVAWIVLGTVLDRLADVPSEDTLAHDPGGSGGEAVAPLPMTLEDVVFAYRPDGPRILGGISATVGRGEFVAVVGANGSGKSTLAKILAGRAPTGGSVHRPGLPGLGRRGGTALVLQRPEAQMLGSRVADDVVWGLPDDAEVDVEALLAEVGLAGLGGRETTDLSGGQQQRLAVAAALARDPALIIADEVTSMVDPRGRDELIELLSALPRRRGMSVVLITHRASEAARADRIVHLDRGRIVDHTPDWIPVAADMADGRDGPSSQSGRPRHEAGAHTVPDARPGGESLLVLDGVGYTYLPGSPWEVPALHDVSLTVGKGDGLLIVGGNGSGKTTLAWVLAGLLRPDTGSCLLDGEPVAENVGDVGLAFQHSRLQLQKPTVGDEIMAVGGLRVGTREVARVLELVGLPRSMAAARTDALSGGQMRRVVLAGLIARRPEVLILDEPLAGLDPYARVEIIDLLARLRSDGQTIVIISHDFDSLSSVCNRRVELVSGYIDNGAADPGTGALLAGGLS